MRSTDLAHLIAGGAILCLTIPVAAQVVTKRPAERVQDRAALPVPEGKTLPRPEAKVPNHTVRLREFPKEDISLWSKQPQVFFIDQGADLGSEPTGYKGRSPIWHLRQRTSDKNSITMHVRREASSERCPVAVSINLNNNVIGRNGYKFNVNKTAISSGTYEQRAGGYNVRDYKLYTGDGGKYERLELNLKVVTSRAPGQLHLLAKDEWICHAAMNFDVFVDGPINVDPLAPPQIVAGSALSKMSRAKGPVSEFEKSLQRVRAKPLPKR